MLPWHSELVLAHIAQAQILARLHLFNEPAGELRLGGAGGTHESVFFKMPNNNNAKDPEKIHSALDSIYGEPSRSLKHDIFN